MLFVVPKNQSSSSQSSITPQSAFNCNNGYQARQKRMLILADKKANSTRSKSNENCVRENVKRSSTTSGSDFTAGCTLISNLDYC